MASQYPCVYFRVSNGARPSSIDMNEIDTLLDLDEGVILQLDTRDENVYFFEIPHELETRTIQQVIGTLMSQPHIDEAWNGFSSVPVIRNGHAARIGPLKYSP